MKAFAALVVAVAACSVTGATAGGKPLPTQTKALAAVNGALATGRIDAPAASRARAEIARAAHLIRALPPGRSAHVAVALSELAAFAKRLTAPRALVLVGQLKANDDWFSKHWAPADRTDVADADGVVYRYFSGRCFEFHPLADFGALNARIAANDQAGAARLGDALVARGVYQPGGGLGFEYDFDFSGGRAPWLSGMAQAVAAQAFARLATLVPEHSTLYLRAAHGAYALIRQRLLTSVAAGPWIRLYGFQSLVVLNAQLQAVVSLQDYARVAHDAGASALAGRMQNAAAATLPRFDTGYWTYYSLPHEPSPTDYQEYVVQLLAKLSSSDARFSAARARFAAYGKQPPAFMLENGPLGTLRVWVSKPATLRVDSSAGPTKRISVDGGWVTLPTRYPAKAGIYPVKVTAVDWFGNRSSFDDLPLVRVTSSANAANAKTVRVPAESPAVAAPNALSIGAALDEPAQAILAQKLGLHIVRLGVVWPAGAAIPDPSLVAALLRVPASVGIVVELAATPLPADPDAQAALAEYAASLAQQVPQLRDLLLTPAPTPKLAPTYADVLLAIRDQVQAVNPSVAVGPLLDGAVAPKATLTALGRAFGASGTPAPFVDVVALRPAPQPATVAQWTALSIPQLVATAASTFGGTAPPVLIDGLAVATTVPSTELGAYAAGLPPATGAIDPTAQSASYAGTITAAACSPAIAGIIIDRIADSATAAVATSGVYYASGTAKPAAQAVAAAAAPAQRGTIVCPGVAVPAAASTLVYPTAISSSSGTQVQLGCVRDCLYVITLDGPDGRPVAAGRGMLNGGAAPATITLPKAKLGTGPYTVEVQLAARVNPGLLTILESPPLGTA